MANFVYIVGQEYLEKKLKENASLLKAVREKIEKN